MDQTAKYTFRIKSARQYFEQVALPCLRDFEVNHTSDRHALIAVVMLWHVKDWVWAQDNIMIEKDLCLTDRDDFDSFLFLKNSGFRIIQNVATGTKHLKCDKGEITNLKITDGFLNGGLLGLGTSSHFTVEYEGETKVFLSVLREAEKFWCNFFASHRII